MGLTIKPYCWCCYIFFNVTAASQQTERVQQKCGVQRIRACSPRAYFKWWANDSSASIIASAKWLVIECPWFQVSHENSHNSTHSSTNPLTTGFIPDEPRMVVKRVPWQCTNSAIPGFLSCDKSSDKPNKPSTKSTGGIDRIQKVGLWHWVCHLQIHYNSSNIWSPKGFLTNKNGLLATKPRLGSFAYLKLAVLDVPRAENCLQDLRNSSCKQSASVISLRTWHLQNQSKL